MRSLVLDHSRRGPAPLPGLARAAAVLLAAATLLLLLPHTASSATRPGGSGPLDAFLSASRVNDGDDGSPTFIQFDIGKQPGLDTFVRSFIAAIPMSADNVLKVQSSKSDALGETHVRLQQYYRNVPVLGGEYIVHLRNGVVRAANGRLAALAYPNATPVLTADAALTLALNRIGAKTYMWQDPRWVAELKERTGDPNATYYPEALLCWSPNEFGVAHAARYALSYQFDIHASEPNQATRVIVDAKTGAIVATLPLESDCTGATLNTIFNGSRGISTDKFTGTNYRLRDDCASPKFRIRDWNSTTLVSAPVEIQNSTNTWTTQNERLGGTVLWEVEQAYQFYLNTYGRNSYDDANGSVEGYINAIFNCAPPAGCTYTDNASMSFSGGTLKVGLGSSGTLANSWSSLDIISHEFTHAVTGSSANLAYANESGALNESFSDCMGEAVENYVTGSADWLEGANRTSGAIRSLSNPKTFTDPDTYLGTNWFTGTGDNGGVHTNSGVQNHWYYLVAAGGSGTNDNGWAYSFSGIGIQKAAAIAYRNLTTYLTSGSTYTDARTGSISAAGDLYGNGSTEQQIVIKAWRAVGIDPCNITCASNVTVDNAAGQCGATVNYSSPTDNGLCFTVTSAAPSGSFFAVGTSAVTATSTSGATCSFNVTVNDAEKPSIACPAAITRECTSYSGTPASDAFIAAWLASATATDNCTATPTISNDAPPTFPHGITTVTFTATDNHSNSRSCSVSANIVDTTPPALACPADLTLECDSHCDASLGGVPATDAAVVAWLASFTAIDICDATLATTLPHPACFKLGDTNVTFTATDDDGNSSSCTRTVHVVDTTPPTIAVSLDRDVLWPPNHNMVTINAAVSIADLCDPSPYFQLISATSNEPDNGLGDGDTANDIQGAALGTADTSVALRSERSGHGTGRVYTLTYRAFDHAGNHADASAIVRVTHDQSGNAVVVTGLNGEGTRLDPAAELFVVAICSQPNPTAIGEGGEELVSGAPGSTPTSPVLLLNAQQLDEQHVLFGNGAGAVAAFRTTRVDANGDGYPDLVAAFRMASIRAIADASTPADGPLGLHYEMRAGSDYLVPDLFVLGAPQANLNIGGILSEDAAATKVAAPPATAVQAAAPVTTAAAVAAPVAIATPLAAVTRTELSAVYPVPVAQNAYVQFSLAKSADVNLAIYDIRGARVRTLKAGMLPAGRYQETWNGRDDAGSAVRRGVYFVHLVAGTYSSGRKIIVMQ